MLHRLMNRNVKTKRQSFSDGIKKGFAVETHLHTSEASACSVSNGRSMAKYCRQVGYSGMIVTDHFFNGNTAIPSHLPWQTRIDLFSKGFENARDEGDRIGLKVFMGWEYGYHGTDFLTLGLDKSWLLAHPDVLDWGLKEYLSNVRRDGGFIIHAHPFRKAPYISKIRLFPALVDAVEVINMRNDNPAYDVSAYRYAREQGLLMTSGSDAHESGYTPGGGIVFDQEISSIHDLIVILRSKRGYRMLGKDRIAKT